MIEIRPVQAEDADALFPLIYQTGVCDTLLWDGPASLEEYRQALSERAGEVQRGEAHFFTIVEAGTGVPAGTCSLRLSDRFPRGDIGLWIGQAHHGKGYGTQVIRRLLEYGFHSLRLEKIETSVFVGNWASRRIFEKNGFVLEGLFHHTVYKRGRPVDEWKLGITQAQFRGETTGPQAVIVHLCPHAAWDAARRAGEYRAPSLETEGFIHCSRPEQVLRVANAFYRGQPSLALLWIGAGRLQVELRWEQADGQVFPHIYGPLNTTAVLAVTDFPAGEDGVFHCLERPLL